MYYRKTPVIGKAISNVIKQKIPVWITKQGLIICTLANQIICILTKLLFSI